MKQRNNWIAICTLALLLVSCKMNQDTINDCIFIGNSNASVELSSIFNNYKLTPLQEDSFLYIGEVEKIKHYEEHYFISDMQGQYIASYNPEGHLQNIFHNTGHSNEEYVKILDFDYDGENIYVLAYPYKLFKLDMNLEIIDVKNLAEDYANISCIRGMVYIYSDQRNQLCYIDENEEIQILHSGEVLKSCPKYNLPIFHKIDDKLLYTSDGSDTIYQIEGTEVQPWLCIDYERKEDILERYAQDKILQGMERIQYPYPAIRTIMKLENSYLILYTYRQVYRIAKIDASNKGLIEDGDVVGTPLPQVQSDGMILSTTYFDKDTRLFLNSKEIDSYDCIKIPKDGCTAIVEYKE